MSNYIVALAVCGWMVSLIVAIVNSALARSNNVALKQVEYRIEVMEMFIPIALELRSGRLEDDFESRFEDVQWRFYLYCNKHEVAAMKQFVGSRGTSQASEKFQALLGVVQGNIRSGLKLDR